MSSTAANPVRVVVADDSAVMRRMLTDALDRADGIDVVGTADDGISALAACRDHEPDVLTLDLSMPNSTGLDVLAALRTDRSPVRVLVVSSFSPTLVERALDVLDAGASDLVAKPRAGEKFADFSTAVVAAVRAVAVSPRRPSTTARVQGGAGAASVAPAPRVNPPRVSMPAPVRRPRVAERVLAIASSTGGPRALGDLVPHLGERLGRGGVLVQHMPPGFTGPLARRLDAASAIGVREAATGDRLDAGTLLVAPGGSHLRVGRNGVVSLDDTTPAVGGIRPRADITIDDLVAAHGAAVVLLVLTGMGNDGLAGARAVREAGGIVLAQDAADCVVYGMPRQVVEHDLADAVGTLTELPALVERAFATPVGR